MIKIWKITVLTILSVTVMFTGMTNAADSRLIGEIPKLTQKIELDGVMDEAVWSQALRIPILYEIEPGENIRSPVATTALLFEDGENLIVGFEAFDDTPSKIRAYLSDRDDVWRSDLVSIKLDTFNDSRKAFQFFVNPLGIQGDVVIDDHTGNTDQSWDAIWHSAGSLTQDGFTVEVKIPYKALRFESGDSSKTWGIEVTRRWPRDVTHRLSNQAKDRNIGCDLCQLNKVKGFADIRAPQNITLTPSLTFVKSDTRNPDSRDLQSGDVDGRESLDFRWGISQNSFVNATLNPDFSQIEADSLQLDVNNISVLSLIEKRAFFLDGKDYFNNWSRIVYTRIFEEPEYGIKYTGNTDGHSLGVITLKDKHTNFLIPHSQGSFLERRENSSSDNTIVRYRYDIGDNGNIGMTYTNRDGDDYSNRVIGVDGKHWFSDSDFVKFQAFWSDSEYPQELVDEYAQLPDSAGQFRGLVAPELSDNAYSVNYTHQGRDWQWAATYHQFGKDFRADSGFISFSNWERKALQLTRVWYPEEDGQWWKHFSISSSWLTSSEVEGEDIDEQTTLNFEIGAIYDSLFGVDLSDRKRYFAGKQFDEGSYIVWGEFKPLADLNINLEYIDADAIDFEELRAGTTDTLISSVEYQFSRQFKAELEFIQQTFDLPEGELFQVDLANLKLAYQFDQRSFLRLILRSSDVDYGLGSTDKQEFRGSQLVYSYKVNPFTLVFVGYSNNADDRFSRLQLQDRTLFMKFSYAWQL